MRASLKAVLCVVVLVAAAAGVQAQRRRTPGRAAPSQPEVAAGTASAPTGSLAERRKQYVALLQVRDSMRNYLATLEPGSPDHAQAAKSLSEVETRVGAVEKSLLAMLASPTLEAPEAPAPVAAPQPTAMTTAAATAPAPLAGPVAATAPPAPRAADSVAAAGGNGPPAVALPPPAAGSQQDSAAPAATPTPAQGVSVWVNELVEQKTIALINQGSNANQTEAPAGSEGSTSLVDQSSASDLIGAAFNLAGLAAGTDDDKDVNSASVTASAYSLFAAFKGADPLDPAFYNRHPKWRKLSFTLGFDNEKKEGDEGATDRVTLAGFKWLIVNGRDATFDEANEARTKSIATALREATISFALLDNEITGFLFRSKSLRREDSPLFRDAFRRHLDAEAANLNVFIGDAEQRAASATNPVLTAQQQEQLRRLQDAQNVRPLKTSEAQDLCDLQPVECVQKELREYRDQLREIDDLRRKRMDQVLVIGNESRWTKTEIGFANAGFKSTLLQRPETFQQVLAALSAEERETLEQFVDARINPFVKLRGESRRLLEEIRARPQFSFAFLSKRRKMGDDEYTSDLIYEKGLGTRMFSTLNAGFKYKDSKLVGGDSRGGKVAGQLQLQLTREDSLVDKNPIYLSFAGDAEWLSGVKPKYRAQAKIKFPVTDGIDIPFSFTVANRTDLINETDVRGQFGFTFDTAKLFRAFRFRLPPLAGAALDFLPLVLPQTPGQ